MLCSVCFWVNNKMILLLYTVLQSNKKEKEAAPTETKNDKELEKKSGALDSSEKPKLPSSQPQLQPHPPSSPAHSESRRSGGKTERGVKRCLKNKASSEKTTTDSVGVKGGDGSVTTSKPVTVTRGEQQPQEPSAKRTVVRLPKITKEAVSSADRETHSVKSTVANGKAPHSHPPAGRSPQTQHRDGDNRAERLDSVQEQKPGAAVAAASHTIRTQVRKVVTLKLPISTLQLAGFVSDIQIQIINTNPRFL